LSIKNLKQEEEKEEEEEYGGKIMMVRNAQGQSQASYYWQELCTIWPFTKI
jgi:hypothetical protein